MVVVTKNRLAAFTLIVCLGAASIALGQESNVEQRKPKNPLVGKWTVSYDWDCDGSSSQTS